MILKTEQIKQLDEQAKLLTDGFSVKAVTGLAFVLERVFVLTINFLLSFKRIIK